MRKQNTPPYYELEKGVKVYKALLSQSGTGAPTAIVLRNTLGEVTWTRQGTGSYEAVNADIVEEKTTVILGSAETIQGGRNVGNGVQVYTMDYDGNLQDSWLNNTAIEVTVYP